MLNPETIKEKEFQTTGRGSYRSDDVDSFLAEVSSSYEQMFRENGDLIKKISILANKVEEYKKDENSLKEALLAAQKLADKIVGDAKEKAKADLASSEQEAKAVLSKAQSDALEIVADSKNKADGAIIEAKKQAEEILGTVNRKVTQESLAFDMLQKESSDFKAKLIAMYKEHLNLINDLPAIAEEKLASLEKASAPIEKEEAVMPSDNEVENDVVTEDAVEEATEVEPQAEEAEQEKDSGIEQFSLSDINTVDSYEDVSSDSHSDKDDGFSLDVSDFDFDEADETPVEEKTADNSLPTVSYAAADDGFTLSDIDDADAEENDDDDDEPVSFKSFFKKK